MAHRLGGPRFRFARVWRGPAARRCLWKGTVAQREAQLLEESRAARVTRPGYAAPADRVAPDSPGRCTKAPCRPRAAEAIDPRAAAGPALARVRCLEEVAAGRSAAATLVRAFVVLPRGHSPCDDMVHMGLTMSIYTTYCGTSSISCQHCNLAACAVLSTGASRAVETRRLGCRLWSGTVPGLAKRSRCRIDRLGSINHLVRRPSAHHASRC